MEAVVWMTGNVGGEVEYREVRDELGFASFRLACTPRLRRGGEWVDGETTWLGVTCSRALAENVRSSISKGDPVIVIGKLRTTRWQDPERGPQERLTIEASAVGHDLSRGTTVFRKNVRSVAAAPVDVAAELIAAVEAQEVEEADPDAA